MIELFEHYPRLEERIPYVRLGEFPAPVIRLRKAGEQIGTDNLYMKQDGLCGPDYGGNKVRKLEFLLGEAQRKGVKEVLTFGFVGSNHALATAIYARQLGLDCISMLIAQPSAGYVRRNLLMGYACGAEMHHADSVAALYIPTVITVLRKTLLRRRRPYIIPPGGSSPLGTIGYVNAGFELKKQVADGLLPEPEKIFIAAGTMGTAAGLTIGLRASGLKTHVVSVRVADYKYANEKKFKKLFDRTTALIHSFDPSFPHVEIRDDEIDFRHDFFGEGYGRYTEAGVAAKALVAETEGVRLDSTYTGKTMAALIDEVKSHGSDHQPVLFWNTHNARDFSEAIKDIDYHQMPGHFHQYFEEGRIE